MIRLEPLQNTKGGRPARVLDINQHFVTARVDLTDGNVGGRQPSPVAHDEARLGGVALTTRGIGDSGGGFSLRPAPESLDGGRVRKLFIGGYEAALRGRTSGILLAGISSSEPRIVKPIFYRPPLEKTSDKLTKPYENESYSRDRKSSSPVRNPFGMVNGLVFMVCGLICLSLWGREAIYFLGRRWGWPAAIVLFVFGFAFTVQGGLILGNSLPD